MTTSAHTPSPSLHHWAAVAAMALTAGLLVASEFLPISLLTPMATDLDVSVGQAGQAISISGLFAVATSLLSPWVTRNWDRRKVQFAYASLMIFSALLVTVAPDYLILMLGRALLGVSVGGFWSMSTALILRLLPENDVPRGIALLNAGVAISGVISAPLGSYLGGYIGWRGTVFLLVPLAAMAAGWLMYRMPAMPPRGLAGRANPLRMLVERQALLGMISTFLVFAGNFALFTYLRPYLEDAVNLSIEMISAGYLALGLAGVAGSWAVGQIIPKRPWMVVIGLPAAMAATALLFTVTYSNAVMVGILLCVWGFVATAVPVGWGAWIARTFGDRAEVAGGLQVATIQLAIMAGAAIGGVVFDGFGWAAPFGLAMLLLIGSSLTAFLTAKDRQFQ